MKKEVMKFYDMLSNSYDELYGEEQINKYLTILKECNLSGNIGDMGCGTCLLAEQIVKLGYNIKWYVGLDISEGMIEVAKRRISRMINADLVVGDMENLPFRDDAFNVVLTITSLQNVPSIKDALSELNRVTRKGLIVSLLKVARNSGEAIERLMKTFLLRKIIIMEKDIALLLYKPSAKRILITVSNTPKKRNP